VISKGGESRHLKETPWKETSKSQEQVNKGGCIKTEKNRPPPGLIAQPLFSLGWVFSTVFLLGWELTKQLNV